MRFRRQQDAAQAGTRALLALFALVVALLLLAVNGALALAYRLSFPWTDGFPALFFETNSALVLLFVLGGCAVETLRLRTGGAHVAQLAGGRPASRDERLERRLLHVVAEMALAANTPAPAAWVLPREQAINAFAAGWRADDAVVAVTLGALQRLERAELQGVVAHEISHLVHGDTRLNMRLIGLVWGLRMVFDFGHGMLERGDGGRRSLLLLPIGIALVTAGAGGWAAGRLLQAAVSRQREFLADASAVKYSRQTLGLGAALRKIAGQQRRGDDRLHAGIGTLAHLLLAARPQWSWWATHPPLAERIRRLYGRAMPALAAELLPMPVADELPGLALASPSGDSATPAPPSADRFQAAFAPTDGEDDALTRSRRWQSAAELRFALLILHGAAPAQDPAPAWAQPMTEQLARLRTPASAALFDALAQRAADTPRQWQQQLLHEAATGVVDGPGLLRWLLLRHRLRRRRPGLVVAGAGDPLARHGADLNRVTQALSTCLGLAAPAERAWAQATLAALSPAPPLPWRAVQPGPALRALLRLQRQLPSLHRPRLARAWVQAWASTNDESGAKAIAALASACALLDTPAPPALAVRLPDLGHHGRGV